MKQYIAVAKDNLLAKRKEMIVELRKWHDGEIENFPPITVFEAMGFMLDELCELEKENRKLRQRLSGAENVQVFDFEEDDGHE